MKIGTSLGKCVKSILAGEVKEEDVFCIVSNTKCPDLDSVLKVIEQYYYDYHNARSARERAYDMSAYSLADACKVAQQLFESGKLHQPRVLTNGIWGNAHQLQDTWYDIMPSPVTDNESVREAWNHYSMIRQLAA